MVTIIICYRNLKVVDNPGTGHAPSSSDRATNLPLNQAADSRAWLEAMDRVLIPALQLVEPAVVILSCGFDAYHEDTVRRSAVFVGRLLLVLGGGI